MTELAPIPTLLYGTAWKEEQTAALSALALQQGFRGIDTANQRKHYFEAAVGRAVQGALAAGTLARGELFLQSKYTFQSGQDHRLPYDANAPVTEQVRQSFESSLVNLGTTYLDSFLLHGPSSRDELRAADVEAWRAIEALSAEGKTRFIGVSNFTLRQLEQLLELAQVRPRFLQNRCYAKTQWDGAVRHLRAEHGVVYQAFSLLTANRAELAVAPVKELASRRGCTTPQLVFAFARQVGMLPLTGTSSVEHMREDLAPLDPPLDPGEVQLLERLAG